MKGENLFDAMSYIDVSLVEEGESYSKKERKAVKTVRKRRKPKWIGSVAAVLAVILCGAIILNSGPGLVMTSYAVSTPEYPKMESYPNLPIGDEIIKWHDSIKEQRKYYGAGKNLNVFFENSIKTMLAGISDENQVFSPVNVYMALSMLAEVSVGETRNQILDTLCAENIDSLRTQVHSVWNACYRDDGKTISKMANSLWLKDNMGYNTQTVNTLSSHYYASVFQGDMHSTEYNKCYREWLKKETGGLLDKMLENKEFDAETVLAIASTLYFSAGWETEFEKELTKKDVFHTPNCDVKCDFMYIEEQGMYYYGDKFSAVTKPLKNDGNMYLILPDEGYNVADLINDKAALGFMSAPSKWEDRIERKINLSMPKFDISQKQDIVSALEKMGITDCFNENSADFSGIFTDMAGGVAVSKVEHGVRVKVDETGCEGAAYTDLHLSGSAAPSNEIIDFTLDRPFIFFITSPDGLPLFIGVVNNPN